ncbi:MAG TPA: hypothetical protein VKY22_11680 [Bradyrhizobium sp.]|nr:hypothetical protein [Bradyrhizobium sp.]
MKGAFVAPSPRLFDRTTAAKIIAVNLQTSMQAGELMESHLADQISTPVAHLATKIRALVVK